MNPQKISIATTQTGIDATASVKTKINLTQYQKFSTDILPPRTYT